MNTIQSEMATLNAVETYFRKTPETWMHARGFCETVFGDGKFDSEDVMRVSNKMGHLNSIGVLVRRSAMDVGYRGRYEYALNPECPVAVRKTITKGPRVSVSKDRYTQTDEWMAQYTDLHHSVTAAALLDQCPHLPTLWSAYGYIESRLKQQRLTRVYSGQKGVRFEYYWKPLGVEAFAVEALAVEDPVVEDPVVEAPVVEAPVVARSVVQLGLCNITVDASTGAVELVVGNTTITIKNVG